MADVAGLPSSSTQLSAAQAARKVTRVTGTGLLIILQHRLLFLEGDWLPSFLGAKYASSREQPQPC